MVRAWYMDNEASNPHLEHQRSPPEFISMSEVFKVSGVEYFNLNTETYASDGVLDEIRKARDYNYEDEVVCSKECLPNLEATLKTFYTEHLHENEEIRFIIGGSGYFDVRDVNDNWIRIQVTPGDMVVLPSGVYHRFTLDEKNYISVKRYFTGSPVWTAHNRPRDNMDCRKAYLEKMKLLDHA